MKFKLFYGWYIVAASVILSAYNCVIFVYGFSAFVEPILTTFTWWSVTQLSLASSLRGLENGVFNPLWGKLSDRFSAKNLMIIGNIISAVGTFALSRTPNLIVYYIGFLILGLGNSLAFGVVPPVVIARWFRKDIGKANGVYAMGAGIGGVMVPIVVSLVDKYGWQDTLMFVSFGFIILGIPLSLVFRDRPEDYGMIPDGEVKNTDKTISKRPVINYDFFTGVRQALKMRAFWYISVVSFFQSAVVGSVTLFVIPYLTNGGDDGAMDRARAGMIVSLFTFISLFTRIPIGMIADVVKKKYLLAFTMGLFTIGMFSFWLLNGQNSFWLVLLFSASCGVALGSIVPLRVPVQAEYFGTRNFGSIFGLTSIAGTLGGVLAAPLAGRVFDTFGSYRTFWFGLAIMGAFLVLLVLTMPVAKIRLPTEEKTETRQIFIH